MSAIHIAGMCTPLQPPFENRLIPGDRSSLEKPPATLLQTHQILYGPILICCGVTGITRDIQSKLKNFNSHNSTPKPPVSSVISQSASSFEEASLVLVDWACGSAGDVQYIYIYICVYVSTCLFVCIYFYFFCVSITLSKVQQT